MSATKSVDKKVEEVPKSVECPIDNVIVAPDAMYITSRTGQGRREIRNIRHKCGRPTDATQCMSIKCPKCVYYYVHIDKCFDANRREAYLRGD